VPDSLLDSNHRATALGGKQTVGLDEVLFFSYIPVEAALVGLLIYRRVWRILPVFFAYCVWDMASNIAVDMFVRLFQTAPHYGARFLQVVTIETIIDSAFLFCVLVEAGWSVLKPIRASLPRSALIVIGVLILLAGAVIWPFASFSGLEHTGASKQWLLIIQLQHTVSILRILFFLILAGGSQLLSIGWRDRELQVVTGLGFYSLIALAVSVLQARQTSGWQYINLNRIDIISFICSLVYWIASFAQQEAKRREFTPQMQNFLLAMAGATHSTRVGLTESRIDKPPKQDQR
jgi:hypothetical protein